MSRDPAAPTVADAIAEARRLDVSRLDAELLLARILDRPRSALIARPEQPLGTDAFVARWRDQLARRAAGEPLAYLVGEKEFYSLMLQVTPAVLVPRPETEILVDWALEILTNPASARAHPAVADLGTGSGAIALSIKRSCPRARVWATDVSPAALAVARANGQRLDLPVTWVESSWWAGFDAEPFHLVVSNPPYIDAADPHLTALAHEPAIALSPGPDGLAALAEIVGGAADRLVEDGWLLLEHGFEQGGPVRSLLASAGWRNVSTRADLAGLPRVTGGQRPDSAR